MTRCCFAAVTTALIWITAHAAHAQPFGPVNHNAPYLEMVNVGGVNNARLAITDVKMNPDKKSVHVSFTVNKFALGVPTGCGDHTGPVIAGPGGGQYIEVLIADGVIATDTRITTVPEVDVPLPDRKDSVSIRAYLCYDDGECVKLDEAMDCWVCDKAGIIWSPSPEKTFLTFNLPRYADRLRTTVLDFHAKGFDPAKYRVKVLVDSEPPEGFQLLESWLPYDLYFPDETVTTHHIRLELIDITGAPVNLRFKVEERTICVRK